MDRVAVSFTCDLYVEGEQKRKTLKGDYMVVLDTTEYLMDQGKQSFTTGRAEIWAVSLCDRGSVQVYGGLKKGRKSDFTDSCAGEGLPVIRKIPPEYCAIFQVLHRGRNLDRIGGPITIKDAQGNKVVCIGKKYRPGDPDRLKYPLDISGPPAEMTIMERGMCLDAEITYENVEPWEGGRMSTVQNIAFFKQTRARLASQPPLHGPEERYPNSYPLLTEKSRRKLDSCLANPNHTTMATQLSESMDADYTGKQPRPPATQAAAPAPLPVPWRRCPRRRAASSAM